MNEFITLTTSARVELTQKKSRFIGIAEPIVNAADAEAKIVAVRQEFPDARHHVYAWRSFVPQQFVRYSDDGEPQGTGGAMVLDVLNKQQVENACVIVVRYFGGILLGVGALSRMYGNAAAEAVAAAKLQLLRQAQTMRLTCSYAAFASLRPRLEAIEVYIISVSYSEMIEFEMCFFASNYDAVVECVANELKAAPDWTQLPPQYIRVEKPTS